MGTVLRRGRGEYLKRSRPVPMRGPIAIPRSTLSFGTQQPTLAWGQQATTDGMNLFYMGDEGAVNGLCRLNTESMTGSIILDAAWAAAGGPGSGGNFYEGGFLTGQHYVFLYYSVVSGNHRLFVAGMNPTTMAIEWFDQLPEFSGNLHWAWTTIMGWDGGDNILIGAEHYATGQKNGILRFNLRTRQFTTRVIDSFSLSDVPLPWNSSTYIPELNAWIICADQYSDQVNWNWIGDSHCLVDATTLEILPGSRVLLSTSHPCAFNYGAFTPWNGYYYSLAGYRNYGTNLTKLNLIRRSPLSISPSDWETFDLIPALQSYLPDLNRAVTHYHMQIVNNYAYVFVTRHSPPPVISSLVLRVDLERPWGTAPIEKLNLADFNPNWIGFNYRTRHPASINGKIFLLPSDGNTPANQPTLIINGGE